MPKEWGDAIAGEHQAGAIRGLSGDEGVVSEHTVERREVTKIFESGNRIHDAGNMALAVANPVDYLVQGCIEEARRAWITFIHWIWLESPVTDRQARQVSDLGCQTLKDRPVLGASDN